MARKSVYKPTTVTASTVNFKEQQAKKNY